MSVGNYTYGPLNILNDSNSNNLKIGNFCSIAEETIFIVSGEHYINHISSFPYKKVVLNYNVSEATSKGDIIVDDDVWIG